MNKKKAVILLSGGLDSAVALFIAKSEGYECHALSFDYGQRHRGELKSAGRIAKLSGASFTSVKIDLPWKGSSLLDCSEPIPLDRSVSSIRRGGIPSTYVPARNTAFLGLAASFAEAIGASDIFIGAHAEDSSGYPDCRPEYLEAFDKVMRTGTRAGLEGRLRLRYPLADKCKKDIILLGASLGVPFRMTRSCYDSGGSACGRCDSCTLRAKGFMEAGLKDPALIDA